MLLSQVLILESIFRKEIAVTKFPERCRIFKIVINWRDIISNEPQPNIIQVYFKHGISIVFDHNNAILFDVEQTEQANVENFINETCNLNLNQTSHFFRSKGTSEDNKHSMENDWGTFFASEKKIQKPFEVNGSETYWETDATIQYHPSNPIRFVSEIMDKLGRQRNAVTNLHFADLLHITIQTNFISIGEIYPQYQSLITDLFRLKSVDDDGYKLLQKSFSSLFNDISVKVEQDRKEETQKRIIIKEKNKEFTIEESASGH